ncbi:MAG TPA: hypothetical protein VGK99_01055 [Acidobacteriota bacterium]
MTLVNPQGLLPRTIPVSANVKATLFDAAGIEIAGTELKLEAGSQIARLLGSEGAVAGLFSKPITVRQGYWW